MNRSPLCIPFFLSLCIAFAFVAATFGQPPTEEKKYPHDVYFDFRGKPLPPELTLTPEGSARFVRSEPEGLRITLPKDRKDLAPIVVATRFVVTGDFEITAAMEILQAEQPRDGFGVGTSLFVNKVDPTAEGATLGRLLRASGKEVVFWDQGFGKKKEDLQFDVDFRPCTEKLFRLRLKRVGAKLFYLLGPGLNGENFESFEPKNFGPNDLQQVLVRVTTGRQPCSVDVRLIDLRIRSGAVPVVPIPPPAPPVQQSRSWLLAAMCVVLTLTLALTSIFGVLLFRRQRTAANVESKKE